MKLVVSLHDVHPTSLAAVAKQRADLRALGVRKTSLLVVPDWHGGERIQADTDFARTITQWQEEGDEVVLHGYTHSCAGLKESASDWFWTRFYTSHEAEFRVLDPAQTRERLVEGRKLFDSLSWSTVGFIAPAWLLAAHTKPILRELGFAYTVTRKSIDALSDGAPALFSTSLCYSTRSGWRRSASRVWNPSLARSLRRESVLRVSLHPGDVAYPAVWSQILRLVGDALKAGRIANSYRDIVATQMMSMRRRPGVDVRANEEVRS